MKNLLETCPNGLTSSAKQTNHGVRKGYTPRAFGELARKHLFCRRWKVGVFLAKGMATMKVIS